MQGNLVVADQWDTRLQLAGSIDRITMNGDEREAAFLIEAQCLEIIIRGDQPEPLPACFSCRLRDFLDQQRAYTDLRLYAIDRHDLAVLIFQRVWPQCSMINCRTHSLSSGVSGLTCRGRLSMGRWGCLL